MRLVVSSVLAIAGVVCLAIAVAYERAMHRHRQPGVTYMDATLRRDGGWRRQDLFTEAGLRHQRRASAFGVAGAALLLAALLAYVLLGMTVSSASAQLVTWPTFTAQRCYVARTAAHPFLDRAPLPQYLLLQAPDTTTPPVRKGGMARVVYRGWAADYVWVPPMGRELRLVAHGIDTADEMRLVPVGDGVRGRALYHGCCGGPPLPRAIEAQSIPCDSVPKRLLLLR